MVKLRTTKIMNIEEIKVYEKNAKRHSENQIDILVKGIQRFGFNVPLVIDKNNVLVAGHARLEAAKKLNLLELPVILVDDLTPSEVKAYRIADNKVSELGLVDDILVMEDLEELNNLDNSLLALTGFGDDFDKLKKVEFLAKESINLDTEFQIVINLSNEQEQKEAYEKLTKEGFKCRILTL